MKYARLLAEYCTSPLAMKPERIAAIGAVLMRAAAGNKLSTDEIRLAIGDAPQAAEARRREASTTAGGVAVLPLYGIISHRIHHVDDISGPGGTSAEGFSRMLRSALNDPAVGSIVIDVDSPGGDVRGVPELAEEIFNAREQKKIVAVANAESASAAYWIGTAAQELVVTPSGEVGSVGVWTAHEDVSKFLETMGVKLTLISAGKFKVEANPWEPLGEEARTAIQSSVDHYYDMFVKAVAKHRGVKASEVRDGFGQGRMVTAQDALAAGMVDRIATLDETVARLASGGRLKPNKAATSVALAARALDLAAIT